MPKPRPRRQIVVVALALFATVVIGLAVNRAAAFYAHPFASVLVDPDAVVSGLGSPTWEGMKQGLRFPDRIATVDGEPVVAQKGEYPARIFDRAVERAWIEGRPSVHVRVVTREGQRELDLPIRRLGGLEWWLLGGVLFIAGACYVLAALTALSASPRGKLARTFAKTALFCALFQATLLDVQTTRTLVPLWALAFPMLPGSFVALALRLPDDARVLQRFPWIVRLLDGIGVLLAAAMILLRELGYPSTPVQQICTVLLAASQLFFVVTFLVRFARAAGPRRDVMRALFGALAPVHTLLGVGMVLSMLTTRGSAAAFLLTLPVLSFTPLSAVVAFIRHDLWGSRALLSRVITLTLVALFTSFVALGLGAAFVTPLGIPFRAALVASAAGAAFSAALVTFALRATERGIFPSRAEYKPTIEQLSEDLTAITDPDDVARSVERTVHRWLDCDYVHVVLRAPMTSSLAPSSLPPPSSRHPLPPSVPPPLLTAPPPPAVGAQALSLPVTFRGHALGVLHVGNKRGGALFTSDDVDLLRTIANQAALAIAHAHIYRELEERRRQQAAAWRGERLALIETLAAEIAHEVRYPINYFRSVFQRGRDGRLDTEEIEIGCEEVDRLERLVSGLRRIAHHRLERRAILLTELASRAEVLLRDALMGREIEIDVPEGINLRCDVDQATQIVVNLLANALDAAGSEGRVGLLWRAGPERDGGELVVWDTGPGWGGDAAQLFAPWFTTKPRGTGLGLAITQRIVRAHGWSIDARRSDGRTQFVVIVPANDLAEPAAEVPSDAPITPAALSS